MYELKMIDAMQLKKAFLDAQYISFQLPRFLIKAPHFVFWLQQYILSLKEFE
jgi:hypothetical protein